MRASARSLLAAVLMAVNPWVIEYSRSTWVQSLLPFFTCALAWGLSHTSGASVPPRTCSGRRPIS